MGHRQGVTAWDRKKNRYTPSRSVLAVGSFLWRCPGVPRWHREPLHDSDRSLRLSIHLRLSFAHSNYWTDNGQAERLEGAGSRASISWKHTQDSSRTGPQDLRVLAVPTILLHYPLRVISELRDLIGLCERWFCPGFVWWVRATAQKQLILGGRSFHFALNRISYLEGVRRRGFWARSNHSKPVLRNAPLKKQLFSPRQKWLVCDQPSQ